MDNKTKPEVLRAIDVHSTRLAEYSARQDVMVLSVTSGALLIMACGAWFAGLAAPAALVSLGAVVSAWGAHRTERRRRKLAKVLEGEKP